MSRTPTEEQRVELKESAGLTKELTAFAYKSYRDLINRRRFFCDINPTLLLPWDELPEDHRSSWINAIDRVLVELATQEKFSKAAKVITDQSLAVIDPTNEYNHFRQEDISDIVFHANRGEQIIDKKKLVTTFTFPLFNDLEIVTEFAAKDVDSFRIEYARMECFERIKAILRKAFEMNGIKIEPEGGAIA